MAFNLFGTKPLTKPVQVYDPTKSVQENMNGQGQPSAANINAAYRTPQAQLQMAAAAPQHSEQQQTTPVKATPVIDPNSPTSGMDAISAMYTSPEQEEKMRKASVANQRILAIGDALRHIGNIYNTVNYAPSQQFNKPWEEEQTRYEKGKAVRDAANARYLSYQQAKAAQDAKQRELDRQFGYKVLHDAATASALQQYRDQTLKERGRIADQNYNLGVRRADDAKAAREAALKEQIRSHKVSEGQRAQGLEMQRERTTAYVNRAKNGGRGSNPYTFPTKNGYINLGRDLNTNQIGKKALFGEMKKAGIIDDVWQRRYDNMYDAQRQSALLNTAISQWLMTDDKAEDYMKKHFGASSVTGGTPASDWEQYEEEEDDWSQYEE